MCNIGASMAWPETWSTPRAWVPPTVALTFSTQLRNQLELAQGVGHEHPEERFGIAWPCFQEAWYVSSACFGVARNVAIRRDVPQEGVVVKRGGVQVAAKRIAGPPPGTDSRSERSAGQ